MFFKILRDDEIIGKRLRRQTRRPFPAGKLYLHRDKFPGFYTALEKFIAEATSSLGCTSPDSRDNLPKCDANGNTPKPVYFQ
jgi:hypothetical protein